MHKKIFIFWGLFLFTASGAGAGWLEDALQEEAKKILTPVVRDLGLGITGGMNTKAAPLSFPGAEISAKMGIAAVSDNNEIIDTDYIPVPILSAEAGLPRNIDIYLRGMTLGDLGGESITLLGGGLRYSFMQDRMLSPFPAVSATAGINRLQAGDDITVNATTLGVSASKKLLFIRPYAGISYEIFSGEFKTEQAGTLKPDDSLLRFNLGAEINPFPALYLAGGIDFNTESKSGAGFYSALGARISLP